MIAAIGKNGELGYNNKLLWRIKEDFNWFKEKTKNKVVVMGRNTYESIGKPLKGRTNVLLTSKEHYNPHPDVIVRNTIGDVLTAFYEEPQIMIIGGEKVYKQFLPLANTLYLTEIDKAFKADTFFPDYDESDWVKIFYAEGKEDVGFDYSFNIYKRLKEKG